MLFDASDSFYIVFLEIFVGDLYVQQKFVESDVNLATFIHLQTSHQIVHLNFVEAFVCRFWHFVVFAFIL